MIVNLLKVKLIPEQNNFAVQYIELIFGHSTLPVVMMGLADITAISFAQVFDQ